MPIKAPSPPKANTTVYGDFKGVDFSKDPYLVDKSRSPYAINVISDKGGQPEKRPGWKVLHELEQPINALAHGYVGDKEVFIAHGGTKLYQWGLSDPYPGYVILKENIADSKSVVFFMQHENKSKMFILTSSEYLVYDGESVKSVEEISTIPTTLIARKPSGGGTVLQPVNLIQPKREERFYGDGSTKIYQLSANNLDSDTVTVKQILATEEKELKEGADFTVNRTTGQVTFTTAPPTAPVTGEDNIYITYSKTIEGYADRIKKCRSFASYGMGGSIRAFVTRNPDYRSYDWWCEHEDPTYFPDLNYAIVGNDNTAIMGYSKIGKYLIIIKEDNQQDTTIFIRYPEISTDNDTPIGKIGFKIDPGITGTGAISPYSFVNLIDEPLFLSRTGIYAITSNIVTAERTLQNRSFYVDNVLTKESNLKEAVAVEWQGYYILSVNGNAYLLDSRQRSEGKNPNLFYYEAYFWNNVHATCFLVDNGELYFGTPTGQICKFKNQTEENYNDNGQPIVSIWSTNSDNDKSPGMIKTMQKKGSGIVPKPQSKSEIKVFIETEKSDQQFPLKTIYADIFDFNNIDFERISFYSSINARFFPFRKKIKKYQTMRFWIVCDALNEGFGIFNIVKKWIPINDVKR